MVITVEGYNGSSNKAPFVAASLSSMISMAAGHKTLAVNLIDSSDDNIERLIKLDNELIKAFEEKQ